MSKYRLLFVSGLVLLIAILSGCGEELPDETSVSTEAPVSVSTVSDETKEKPEEAVFLSSCEIAMFGNSAVFVDKTDMLLKKLNMDSGEINVLYGASMYGEFILDGTKILFTNGENGMLTVGDILKGDYRELACMSLSKGAKFGDWVYLIDEEKPGEEYVLYRYNLSSQRWDNRRLSGGYCSPNSETVFFGESSLWYLASGSECVELCAVDYDRLDVKSVFRSSAQNGITDFCVSEGKLYFADSNRDIYAVDENTCEAVKFLDGAIRLYSASSEGVYYQKSAGYPLRLYLGNLKGNSVDIAGGVVVSSYGSRCLLRRFSGGQEQLVMVKYPDDAVVFSRECSLFDTVSNGQYVIAFINDSRYLYFFDLGTGDEAYFENARISHKECTVEEYYLDETGFVYPSESCLAELDAEGVADLFLEAIRRNDRYFLDLLICEGDYLTPYVSFDFKSYELIETSRTETTVRYSVRFAHYTDADLSLQGYMPDCLKKGGIVLVYENGLWKVDTNAS